MKKSTNSFVTGAIALVFAVLGYQTALLIHYSAVSRIVAGRDRPDTVFVYGNGDGPAKAGDVKPESGLTGNGGSRGNISNKVVQRKNSGHEERAEHIRKTAPPQKTEVFRFNPNTVSVEDMIRLGFTAKQAESINRYRVKGGRFRRKEDFAKSYTVSDAMYRRLESYIDIPLLDINAADSADFDTLPGIGGYFAGKMVEYRSRLHGYSCTEQLMDIYHFDKEKYDALKDLITAGCAEAYPLWSLPADSLRMHPYIGDYSTARSIVFYREHNPCEEWTVEGLASAGILSPDQAARLSRCRLR